MNFKMIHNIYDYLKYKWEHCDKEDVLFVAIVVWAASHMATLIFNAIWMPLGAISLALWAMIGLIGCLSVVRYVFKGLREQVSEDYHHYVSEFGKHKNEDVLPAEQMKPLDEWFEEYEDVDREHGTTRGR